jgi:peroxiredoxin
MLWLAGCGGSSVPVPVGGYGEDYRQIQFKDKVQSNELGDQSIGDFVFTDINGNQTSLQEYRGKKNVVLVVTRGYAGSVCLYCATQTSRLLTSYSQFSRRDTEVVVVFPIETTDDSRRHRDFVVSVKNKLDTPVEKIPFPIVLDVELKVVDQLGIRKDLSKPATYILDKEGQTRFAYVGESLADRPSVKALIEQLELLNREAAGTTETVGRGEP